MWRMVIEGHFLRTDEPVIAGTVQSTKCKGLLYRDTNRLEIKNLQPKSAESEALRISERGGTQIEERAPQDIQEGRNIEDTGLVWTGYWIIAQVKRQRDRISPAQL